MAKKYAYLCFNLYIIQPFISLYFFFFLEPYQYVKHMLVKPNFDLIKRWLDRSIGQLRSLTFSQEPKDKKMINLREEREKYIYKRIVNPC